MATNVPGVREISPNALKSAFDPRHDICLRVKDTFDSEGVPLTPDTSPGQGPGDKTGLGHTVSGHLRMGPFGAPPLRSPALFLGASGVPEPLIYISGGEVPLRISTDP